MRFRHLARLAQQRHTTLGTSRPAEKTTIDDIFIETAVAGLAAAAACAVAVAVLGRLERRIPTIVAPVVAVVVCWPLAETPPARFLDSATWRYPRAVTTSLVIAVGIFGLAALGTRADQQRRRWLTMGVAAVALTAFLSIPETGILRLAPGPLTVVAAATLVLHRVPPFGPTAAMAVVAVVAGLAIVGGTSRPTSVLGVSCALALAATAAVMPAARAGRRFATSGPAGAVIAAVAVGRIASTTSSSAAAALLTTCSLAAAAVVVAGNHRRAGPRRVRSEQLEGPQRQ